MATNDSTTASTADNGLPKAWLIGNPIAHSLSPLMQNTIYKSLSLQHTYNLHETADLATGLPLLREPSTFGAAITMPYKITIIPHLDSLTPQGAAIGAINTVFFTQHPTTGARVLNGTNTDCIGVAQGILRNASPEAAAHIRGRPAVIVGGGGTCRAAVYALREFLGVSRIYILNRDPSEVAPVLADPVMNPPACPVIHLNSLAQAETLEPPAVVVSAIPDFTPVTEAELLVRKLLETLLERGAGQGGDHLLLEMCYHPSSKTQVTAVAKARGWTVVPGTEAMVWQGMEQVRLWTGYTAEDIDVAKVKAVIQEALEKH